MATIYDIAKMTGVSSATVSRVLNGVDHPVKEETKKKILDAAQRLRYRPNTIAKSLTRGRTNTIAILLPSIVSDFYTQFVNVIENHISEEGYSTFLCNTHRNIEKETRFVNTLIERRVDGVVFCPTRVKAGDNEVNRQNIRMLCDEGIPVVAIGSHFTGVSQVYTDTFEGARRATEYLISLGHRKIGFIDGLKAGTGRRRYRGYAAALKAHGIACSEEFLRYGDLTAGSGERRANELFDAVKPTAVFCVNNEMAAGVLKAAAGRKISVPGDLSVIGFDDSAVSRLMTPELTVVRQPLEAIGENVRRLLSGLMSGDSEIETVRLLPELVIRDSCTAAPRS